MKRLSINMIMAIMYKMIAMITGLIVQQQILTNYGSDVNGMSSSINQFLSYLALLEAGIGAASIQALFKPISSNKWDEASEIINATERQYRLIGGYFLIGIIGLSFLMPVIISNQMDAILVGAFTFVSGLSRVVAYSMIGKYTAILNADQKIGVVYLIDGFTEILSCIARLVMISCGLNIVIVQSALVCSTLIKAIVIRIYIKYWYGNKIVKTKNINNQAIAQRWNVLIHQISGMIVNHTDVTLLTIFSTLKEVSVYSVYNYIYSNISSILTMSFSNAALGTFGKKASGDHDEFNRFYHVYENLFFTVLFTVLTVALLLTLPFVRLYTAGVSDTQYIYWYIAVLFCIIQFMNLVRIPALVTINAYGWFKETQRGAIIEAIINIIVSLILLNVWGMAGLLIGTFCSYLFRTQDIIRFVYKRCGLRWSKFAKMILINLSISGVLIVLFFFINPIIAENWREWLIKAVIMTLITLFCFTVSAYLQNRKQSNVFIRNIYYKVKRRKE